MRATALSALLSRSTLVALFALYPVFVTWWYAGFFLLTLLGLLAVIGADIWARKGRLWFDVRPISVYVLFLMPLASGIWAKYPGITLWQGSLVLVNVAIFYLASIANAQNMDRLISRLVLLIPFVFLSLFAWMLYKYGSVRSQSVSMAQEFGSVSNVGQAFVVLCVPYLMVLPGNMVRKILIWASVFAAILVVLLSQSRGAYLMLVITLLLSIYFLPARQYERVQKIFVLTGAILLAVGVCSMILGVDRVVSPVLERFQQSQLIGGNGFVGPIRKGDDYRRAIVYSEGIHAIIEEPILGIGYGGLYGYIGDRYGFGSVSHNVVITAWGEMGIPGLIALVWVFVAAVARLNQRRKYYPKNSSGSLMASATLVALAVIFIHSQFRPFFTNPMLPILLAQAYSRAIPRFVR